MGAARTPSRLRNLLDAIAADASPTMVDAALSVMAGLRAREDLLRAEGGTLTAEHLAQVLGISRQAVDYRRRKGKLLALTLGRRGYAYPAWQIVGGRVIAGLDAVLGELRDLDPWTRAAFMLTPNTWLDDETPLDELRRGHMDRVREAASIYGEQVAA